MAKKASKTVQIVLQEKGISHDVMAIRAFLEGKEVVIQNQTGTHNYGATGSKFTITFVEMAGGSSSQCTTQYISNAKKGGCYTNALYFTQIAFASADTIPDLEVEIKKNKDKIKELQKDNESLSMKIEFMKENDMEEYDENVFKSYEVMKLLEKEGMTTIEKAKIIAKIIKSS